MLCLGLNLLGLDGKALERLERNGVDVGAASGNDEALDGGKGKVAGGTRQEGLGRGNLLLLGSEEAVLLSFVADDGRHGAHEAVVLRAGKDVRDVLQRAQDQIGEGLGEADGALEIGDREAVSARLDLGLVEVLERPVCVEQVQFFLGDNGLDGVEHIALLLAEVVARCPAGDVGRELGEEGNLEQLIQGNQLEVCEALRGH